MRARALTFSVAGIALLGVIAAWQYWANARLRVQVDAAKMAAAPTPPRSIAVLVGREGATRDESEAAKLRAQIYAAETRLQTLREKTAKPRDGVSGPRPPSWTNLGNASPTAAMETAIWAQATANAEVLARSLSFDPPAQVELQKMFSALAAEDRQNFGTPERMAAELIIQLTDQSPAKEVNGATISLIENSTGADEAEVVMRMTVPERNLTKDVKTLKLRREVGGWKVVLPIGEVTALKDALVLSGQAMPPSQRALRGKQ